MIESRTDVWGVAALAQPNGPSYEFFADLLPPVRWVNTDFRHYPLVLSAPRGPRKVRFVSNGSGVNLRANNPPMWHEPGTPVLFYVGDPSESFGQVLGRLEGPRYHKGYLPVVKLKYRRFGVTYHQEAFAPVDGSSAPHGAVMVRFSVSDIIADGGTTNLGRIEARFESPSPLRAEHGQVLNDKGLCLAAFASAWRWDAQRNALAAVLPNGQSAELTIFTKPVEQAPRMSATLYDERKQQCLATWNKLLRRCVRLQTPEPLVNDAWRATLIGTFMIAVGDRLHYSAGNAYAKLYEAECGDTFRSVMLFGHVDLAPAMLRPLLEFDRFDTRFHVAGHKLQLLAYFYWLTRDVETIRAYESLWRPSVELILASREPDSGLLPKDRYAGDIKEKVYSLNSNANCWRALRDVAAMLQELGDNDEARRLQQEADEYRQAILDAVANSELLDTQPPFIPNALLADEPPHDPLTDTRTGSYYDLMCPYIIGSEIFGQGSQREDWLLAYLQQHGGICLGMPRTKPSQGEFKDEPGIVPLYALRYQLALLRRDEREKALVGFYGHLAQGMTPHTFVGGEGNRFLHADANGRSFYLPPNSTSNATWLITLRHLLIQDWDLDEDARPETLRLLYAVPRRWLADARQIHIENAPTHFGNVSLRVEAKLSEGYVEARVEPPPRPIKTMLLRAPLPEGWRIDSVEIDGTPAPLLPGDVVDLSGHTAPLTARFNVSRSS
jgi:hypothetical protein